MANRFDASWTEWLTEREGKFTERVYVRRKNPFAFYGPISTLYLVFIYGAVALGFGDFIWPFLNAFGPIPRFDLIFAGIVALWMAWGFLSRWYAKDIGTRRPEDTYYPPREYLDAISDEEKARILSELGVESEVIPIEHTLTEEERNAAVETGT